MLVLNAIVIISFIGDNQVDIDEDLFKQRVSSTGQLIGAKSSDGIGKVRIMTHIHSFTDTNILIL